MCGISGYFHYDQRQQGFTSLDIESSLQLIKHRGPDASGKYISSNGRCCLGHVRLSIIDLQGGQQPLEDDNIHAVVNGELYDFKRIRKELQAQGHVFKTESDSEIALFLYKEYGLSFVDHLRGEFAIAIYDAKKNRVVLVRDRYGIKPMYYTVVNGTLLFASEIKAFLPLGWKPEWDLDSIIHNGIYFDSRTCFKGVYKLPAANYLVATSTGSIHVQPYWDINFPNKYQKETRSVDEMVQGVRERLVDSVRQRMVADVPVAVFLSGGIDSSAVAGIANEILKEQNPEARVKAFSISFKDGGIFDEGDIAERTAKFIDADFEKVSLTEDELLSNFTNLIWYTEHPCFNLSMVARYILAKKTQEQGYKVVLTGEGSDEHFGGYIYFQGDYALEQDYALPEGFETITEEQRLARLSQFGANKNFSRYIPTSHSENKQSVASKILKGLIAPALLGSGVSMGQQYYCREAIEQCGAPDHMLSFAENSMNGLTRQKVQKEWHPLHSAMYIQTRTLLQNLLLSSPGERCDMAFSIESRTPFLDHPLTEYVMSLPPSVKIKGDPKNDKLNEKWILKEAAKPFITHELYTRTKEPFLAPMARGHNTVFVDMVNEYLSQENIERLGWIDYNVVKTAIDRYIEEGSHDNRVYQDILFLVSFVVISKRFHVATFKF